MVQQPVDLDDGAIPSIAPIRQSQTLTRQKSVAGQLMHVPTTALRGPSSFMSSKHAKRRCTCRRKATEWRSHFWHARQPKHLGLTRTKHVHIKQVEGNPVLEKLLDLKVSVAQMSAKVELQRASRESLPSQDQHRDDDASPGSRPCATSGTKGGVLSRLAPRGSAFSFSACFSNSNAHSNSSNKSPL
ncbi:hypothetical protein H257_02555 [Aphanomyces astaci]|uniref:Uncharacterized protein n=1 Tax=Aphanomyces astaci TaxID=112090 RepID=W4H257_APHAT|nr:hypothetical protein H257_02555 [Aphanomyces astaci]ETV86070.1 hypothetical protein H257_02555 [Aphanomyces astaci]|eukprot:XP_009824542.1 hypothetical protein H257_02555 [Aphanomyces astaci]